MTFHLSTRHFEGFAGWTSIAPSTGMRFQSLVMVDGTSFIPLLLWGMIGFVFPSCKKPCPITGAIAFLVVRISLPSICLTANPVCWWSILTYCVMPFVKPDNPARFISMRGWCCRIICIVSGHCLNTMRIIPGAGRRLKKLFRNPFRKTNSARLCNSNARNVASGSGASGNTPLSVTAIMPRMLIIFISIRSSMAGCKRSGIGPIQLFIGGLNAAYIVGLGG